MKMKSEYCQLSYAEKDLMEVKKQLNSQVN